MSSGAQRAQDGAQEPPLSAGFLAALPLFLAYELGLALLAGAAARSSAEWVVARSLFLFGARAHWARLALLGVAAALAYARLRAAPVRAGESHARLVFRSVGVGVLAGMALGPALTLLLLWLDHGGWHAGAEPVRSLAWTLRLVGAAPWEELLFRVGAYGGVFLVVRHALGFLGAAPRAARAVAELAALLGSALFFALFHLDGVQSWIGSSGEPFHQGLFLWRVTAGILLGGLFRWRGLGVCAWAHAVFNLEIALGIVRL